jgi:hypothetical protein
MQAAPVRGLAVELLDGGLEPRLPASTVLVIDRDLAPKSGDIVVVALLRTSEVLCRRFKPGRGKAFELYGDNELVPAREITDAHQPITLGTLVEAVLVGSV